MQPQNAKQPYPAVFPKQLAAGPGVRGVRRAGEHGAADRRADAPRAASLGPGEARSDEEPGAP